jgi:hypothetical protein
MIDTLKIEKGIPVATTSTRYGFLDQLEPGESALLTNVNISSLAACMQYRQKRYGKKFTRRTVESGVRVWRTA